MVLSSIRRRAWVELDALKSGHIVGKWFDNKAVHSRKVCTCLCFGRELGIKYYFNKPLSRNEIKDMISKEFSYALN